MKIPETSANVGAYYGNEENGQWQPNGMIIDSGVGGGVVGSGDAGVHRPPVYPVHIPRGHVPAPGYVMAGPYYPPAPYPPVPAQPQDDFADYMWMENEEEFDKQVMQQLEEEALMEQCIEAMLEDEQRERQNRPMANGHKQPHNPTTSNGGPPVSLEEAVSKSTLNPLAAEFIPTYVRIPQPTQPEPIQDQPQTSPAEESRDSPESTLSTDPSPTSEHSPETEQPSSDSPSNDETTPVVSATDATEKIENKIKEIKKDNKVKPEVKKAAKVETKPKVKPVVVKSEVKVPPKKKEVVKEVKSEVKEEKALSDSEKNDEPTVEAPKATTPPAEEPQTNTGFKPINYAAAAKAAKPKKVSASTTPPASVVEKASAPKPKPIEKKEKKVEKPVKTDKPTVQRKNSAK